MLLHRLYRKSYLRLDRQLYEVSLCNWWDGAELLDRGFSLNLLAIMYEETLVVPCASFADVTRPYTTGLGFVTETIVSAQAFRRIQGESAPEIMVPFTVSIPEAGPAPITFQFILALSTADNKGVDEAIGNKCSGPHRCSKCNKLLNVHGQALTVLFDFIHSRNECTIKTLQLDMQVANGRAPKKTFAKLGKNSADPILCGDFTTPLSQRGLDKLLLGEDNLHTLSKGAVKAFITWEKALPSWDEEKFTDLVSTHLHRKGTHVLSISLISLV